MRRIFNNSAKNTIEWLLLIALAMLLCFASCKKNTESGDTSSTGGGAVRVDSGAAGSDDSSGSAVPEPAESETGAAGETPAEGEEGSAAEPAEDAEGSTEGEGENEGENEGAGDGGSGDSGSEGNGEGTAEEGEGSGEESGGTETVDAAIDPSKVYVDNGCTLCHKVDRSGGTLGPDIRNIAEYWDSASLTTYLKNPAANIARYPRLVEIGKENNYLAEMPPLREKDDARIKALVDWLLTPPE